MNELSLISIIIPCFNDAAYIEQAVQSALDQTYENKEIIVVDDGSNGKTKAVLKNLESKISLLVTQENEGVSAARNRGIAASTGQYILILDSDDFFEPEFCERAVNYFELDREVKILTCYAKWFKSEQDFQIFKPSGGKLEDFLLKNCSLGTMFKKSVWEITGGYDENMRIGYEDWEFYIRILALGGEAKVIPEVLFNYRNKKNSRNKKANEYKYDLIRYIYIKHSNLYKENFALLINYWLDSLKKSEAYKQQMIDSIDYKIGYKLLKPLRLLGLLRKK